MPDGSQVWPNGLATAAAWELHRIESVAEEERQMQNRDSDETDGPAVKGAQALFRALDLLDEIMEGPARVADLARKLNLNKATTYRLAQALRSRGYLADAQDGYTLGPKLLQMGATAQAQTDYVQLARPHLEQLSEVTGFCVFIGKREGDWSRHLDRVTGRQRLRVATSPGDRRFITETGLGKALLLDEPEARLDALLRQAQPSLSSADLRLWLDVMKVHAGRQYVLHDSELNDGVRSIAAPVRNVGGAIVVAISIAGAGHDLSDTVMNELAGPVRETAGKLSAALGYTATSDLSGERSWGRPLG